MIGKHSAGQNIASHCTKCKLVLDHVIVAMNGETIAKVKCKTCGSTHNYQGEGTRKPRATTVRKRQEAVKASEALWQSSVAEAKGKEHVYEMSATYRVGDIVNHQVFGKGIVRKVYLNKCDVLFQDKERLMATGNH